MLRAVAIRISIFLYFWPSVRAMPKFFCRSTFGMNRPPSLDRVSLHRNGSQTLALLNWGNIVSSLYPLNPSSLVIRFFGVGVVGPHWAAFLLFSHEPDWRSSINRVSQRPLLVGAMLSLRHTRPYSRSLACAVFKPLETTSGYPALSSGALDKESIVFELFCEQWKWVTCYVSILLESPVFQGVGRASAIA